MEDLSAGWLHDLEMEDSGLINQCYMATAADVFDFRDLSPEAHQLSLEASDLTADASWTITKPGDHGGSSVGPPLPLFREPSPVSATPNREIPAAPKMGNDEYLNLFNLSPNRSFSDVLEDSTEIIESKSVTRPALQAKNHIMAERKRRERLNQKLIALAALIPGLKKTDKASILGDATRHIKYLEERVKQLERDQSKKEEDDKPTVINAKRSRQHRYEEASSSEDNSSYDNSFKMNNKPFPEVDMRVSDKHVVLRIHCKKQEGLLGNIFNELDNFSINIISTSTLPFVDAAVDITIIGKMIDGKGTKVENKLKGLRMAILKFIS